MRRLLNKLEAAKLRQKNATGFTIIEVMIVLAVAAVILLIVFLAVPALQRNSRNTQYRSEAGRLLGAANEFVTNAQGKLPSTSGDSCGPASGMAVALCSGAVTVDAQSIWQNANNPTNFTSLSVNAGPASGTTDATPALGASPLALLYTAATCSQANGVKYTIASGPAKSMILVYATESTGGAVVAQCQST